MPSGRGRPFCRITQYEVHNIQINTSTLYMYIKASKCHISIIAHNLFSFKHTLSIYDGMKLNIKIISSRYICMCKKWQVVY